uniref:GP-PDE domain-containing protein n=1 Tax=Lotharella oceanica TaxID=641309 RepID=A0A7S2XDJ8_9EUKA|mmetsp:Transcript_31503/g.58773  ORF Transcript_31503/g.58773 Transcript_31503/m.58773 type:complete len:287 (+) Transcript_31503:16-876(+)
MSDGKPYVIAHRGASHEAPENTLDAVNAALIPGVDMVECDVHMTKDGQVVVIHDATVDRTTNGRGAVEDHTMEQISKLNANNGNDEYEWCKVPTLAEWLKLVLNGEKIPLIELKPGKTGPYKGMAAKVYQIIRKAGASRKAVFQSFEHSYLEELRKMDSKIKLHTLYVFPQINLNVIGTNKAIGSESVNVYHGAANRAFTQAMHQHGFKVMVYTVDAPGRMLKMIKNGVDGIITNKPALLIDVINHPEKYTIDTDYTWTMAGVAMVGMFLIAAWCFFPRATTRRRD